MEIYASTGKQGHYTDLVEGDAPARCGLARVLLQEPTRNLIELVGRFEIG